MPDPTPVGETFFRPIVRAICAAEPEKVPCGGFVESVVTFLTQRLRDRFFVIAVA